MPTQTSPRVPGLHTKTAAVPLEHVDVKASIHDAHARVSIAQRYRNHEAQPVEALYVFPLDERAAVCGFAAVVNGVRYEGQVKSREDAFATYDDALADGHGGFLLDEDRPDVFTASLGHIVPGGEVQLELTYLTDLSIEGDAIRFTLPTTVSPRYAPAVDHTGVGRSDAETLNPPRASDVPYGLSFTATIEAGGRVRRVESPSHPVSVAMDGDTVTVALAQREVALDRDVVLLITSSDVGAPHVALERDADGKVAAALTFRPVLARDPQPVDVVFVVDQSGSMEGSSIAEVRNTLQLCLRSLDAGSSFNIVGFGDRFTSLFESCTPYGDGSLKTATTHVDSLEASLGGTEILPALEFVFRQAGTSRLLQVIVLTDGQVTNTDAVLELTRAHAGRVRVFSFGIGRGASQHLVNGLARAGGGAAEFIYPGERIEAKVMRQFQRMMTPVLSHVQLDWGGLQATVVPSTLPPVFGDEPLKAYAWLEDLAAPATVTLRGSGPAGPLSWSLEVTPAAVRSGSTIGALVARARIRELEEGSVWRPSRGSLQRDRGRERVAAEIVKLATTYGLASRETSWVVIEKREVPVAGEAVLRRVPVAITSGWGGGRPDTVDALMLEADTAFLDVPSMPARAMLKKRSSSPISSSSRLGGWIPRLGARIPPSLSAEDGVSAFRRVPAPRPLDRLIARQAADGSWELDETLASICGVRFETVEKIAAISAPSDQARRAFATALALTFLQRFAASSASEWGLLARKAERWLHGVRVAPTNGGTWMELAESVVMQAEPADL